MRNPHLWSAMGIRNCPDVFHKGKWIPSRGSSYSGWHFLYNLKLAWFVFIGKYDVVDWEND